MWITDRYRSLGKVDVAVLIDEVSSYPKLFGWKTKNCVSD